MPGFHFHEMLLTGLGSILFAAVYALTPMLANVQLDERLGNMHFWPWMISEIGMSFSMGLAWREGMLRRTLYFTDRFLPFMIPAWIF